MACIATLLGFDIDSQKFACIRYRVNPQTYYLTTDINTTPNLNTPATAYTNSSCTVELGPAGYFAYDAGFRFYSKPTGAEYTLTPLDTCQTSTKVKKCCGGNEIYNATNLQGVLFFPAPVGMIIDMTVTDSNNKTFRTCFEVVEPSLISSSNLFVTVKHNLYGHNQCSVCMTNLQNQGIDCYLTQGNYTFENCDTGQRIGLTIPVSNVFQVGDVTLFNGKCYFATLIEPVPTITGTTSNTPLSNGCNNLSCAPIIPPQTPKSMYVSGCCDNKVYRLQSMSTYNVGSFISAGVSKFCYRVIPTPQNPASALILPDSLGVIQTTGCNDTKCQPCPTTPIINNPRGIANQCGIITKFKLTLECNTIDPTLQNMNGGILSLNILGGTPPYKVVWFAPGGSTFTGQTWGGRPGGSYTAIVTDKWAEYTETITCNLFSPINCNWDGLLSTVPSLSCDGNVGLVGYAYSSKLC